MTWFKENKFLAGLIAITLVLAAAIIFFGLGASKDLEEVQAEIAAKQSSLERMKKLDPYPTDESAKAKEVSLKAVLAKANEVRDKKLAFRPESLADVPGKAFSENLSATVAKVKELFPDEGALPTGFNLGFESYTGTLPKEGATGILSYELGALEYVFEKLAAAGVTELVNLHRKKIPAENGEEWPDAVGGKARPRKGSAARRRPASRRTSRGGPRRPSVTFEDLPPVAHRLPFELVFKGSEVAVREVLTSLANSEEYFFQVRAGRVYNPSPIPTAGKSVAAAKPKENDFGGFTVEGSEPAPAAASSAKILEKVSGGDELVIYLNADLLLFIEEQKFPELK